MLPNVKKRRVDKAGNAISAGQSEKNWYKDRHNRVKGHRNLLVFLSFILLVALIVMVIVIQIVFNMNIC